MKKKKKEKKWFFSQKSFLLLLVIPTTVLYTFVIQKSLDLEFKNLLSFIILDSIIIILSCFGIKELNKHKKLKFYQELTFERYNTKKNGFNYTTGVLTLVIVKVLIESILTILN